MGDYDEGTDIITLYTTSQNPHLGARPAVGVSWASRRRTSCASSRPTSAAASAPRSSSTPKRRCAPGRPRRSTGRSSGPPSAPSPSLDAHGRDHVTHAELALDASGKILGMRVHTIANLGALSFDLLVGGADMPLRAASVWPVRHPRHLRRGRRGLHEHRAGRRLRGAGRPEATFLVERMVEEAARETGHDPGGVPSQATSSPRSRIRRRSS